MLLNCFVNMYEKIQTLDVLTVVEKGTFKRFLIVIILGCIIFLSEKLEFKFELKRIEKLQEKIKDIIFNYKKKTLSIISTVNKMNLKTNLDKVDNCFVDCMNAYVNDYNTIVENYNKVNDEIIFLLKTGETVDERYNFLQEHTQELDDLKANRDRLETELTNITETADIINEKILQYYESEMPYIDEMTQMSLKLNISEINECFTACYESYKDDYNSVIKLHNELIRQSNTILSVVLPYKEKFAFIQDKTSELENLKIKRQQAKLELNHVMEMADCINGIIQGYYENEIPLVQSTHRLGLKVNISEIDECFRNCEDTYRDDYNYAINYFNELNQQITSILSVVLLCNEKISFLKGKSNELENLKTERELARQDINKVIEIADSINSLIIKYYTKPLNLEKFTKPVPITITNSCIDKEFNSKIDARKEKLDRIISDYNAINFKIKNILLINQPIKDKYDFLNARLNELDKLYSERSNLFSKYTYCNNEKINIPNNYKGTIRSLRDAFDLVNKSEKHSFYNLTLKNRLSTNCLNLFKYTDSPFIISVGNIDCCFFGEVVLLFDCNGFYLTSLKVSALKIFVEKHEERVDICSKYYPRNNTGSDSKCVDYGKTTTTWLYTRMDGQPDRRYKDNPMIKHCYNTYEYAKIFIGLGDIMCSCNTSSWKAIDSFENIIKGNRDNYYSNIISISS